MPTRDDIRQLCDAYIAAVSAHDLDAVIALFAEDAVQHEPVGSPPNVGRAAILGFFRASNDVPFTLTRFGPVTVVGDRAAFQVHVAMDTPNGPFAMTTTDVITVDENCRITEILAFPDREASPDDAPGARLVFAR
ncbi:SgcJ/EcaC family oxidoreductase [Sphaerimonospora cavernae]|uniref:SgcJ/EcaC family oxidoreductase n=1 Tax=Sphaerimonospora cavernae TaxID=1740611 RepID=A0ABV6UDE8_9ACTN